MSLESDASYFASYSRLAIHEEMLSDAVRTDGYRHAIESNGGLLQGKVVLDVGCGSGGEIWGDMGRYGEIWGDTTASPPCSLGIERSLS